MILLDFQCCYSGMALEQWISIVWPDSYLGLLDRYAMVKMMCNFLWQPKHQLSVITELCTCMGFSARFVWHQIWYFVLSDWLMQFWCDLSLLCTTNIAASRLTDHPWYRWYWYYHSYARKFLCRDRRQVLQWRHRPGPLPGSSGQLKLKAAFALPSAAPSTDFRKTRSRVYMWCVWQSMARSRIDLVSYEALLVYVLGPW